MEVLEDFAGNETLGLGLDSTGKSWRGFARGLYGPITATWSRDVKLSQRLRHLRRKVRSCMLRSWFRTPRCKLQTYRVLVLNH